MDIAQAIADVKPGFWRFPGGNNLEGASTADRWIWNNTVGPLQSRPGRQGDWGYANTDGLGLKEYLDFIEDVGMEPIMAVWAGYSFGGAVTSTSIQPFIQEAIDQINFVIGDPTQSAAAALRSSLGHPEPYALTYVEIGNEDFADSSGSYASYRWKDFVTTLSTTFPHLNFLATTFVNDPVLSPKTNFWDVHDYNTPSWFFQNAFRFDSFARDGTKYFEGEYAAINTNASNLFGSGPTRLSFPQMQGSAGEAAYMTDLERNADIVFAASYAPMLQSANNFQWTPNLISFDAGNVYLSTSYYVQKLFSLAKGALYLPSTLPSSTGSVHWSVTRSSSSGGQIFIKIVNAGSAAATINVSLPFAVSSSGSAQILSGAMAASNTPTAPQTVVPKTQSFTASKSFSFNAAAFSVNVLTLQAS